MVVFLGGEYIEREKETESNGLEERLSPNAVVLMVVVVVNLVVVKVFEDFSYGLTCYDEYNAEDNGWPMVEFPVRVSECDQILLGINWYMHKCFCEIKNNNKD